jgi:uncharacterized protein (DUF2252 family)
MQVRIYTHRSARVVVAARIIIRAMMLLTVVFGQSNHRL